MEKGQRKPGPKERMFMATRRAFSSGDVLQLATSLIELNELLTGEHLGDFSTDEGSEDRLKQGLSDFFTQARRGFAQHSVYLGDGGFSRIMFEAVDGKVEVILAPVSLPDVKEKWDVLK